MINIGVIGGHKASSRHLLAARRVGKEIARMGALLICGGLTGVMAAACRGAKEEGGQTMGILPGTNREDANKYVDFPVATGLSLARNVLVVRNSDILIAIDGKYGTLSEISFALQYGIPVISLNSWDIKGVIKARDVKHCFAIVKRMIKKTGGR